MRAMSRVKALSPMFLQPFISHSGSQKFIGTFMLVYKRYPSVKQAVKDWVSWVKSDTGFRRILLLVFYTVMILFRTLLNRHMWANPVSNVFGT